MYKMDSRRSDGGDRHAMLLITLTFEQWSSWRRAAGCQIDPRTAEVMWDYRLILDPYGVAASQKSTNKSGANTLHVHSPEEVAETISCLDGPAERNAVMPSQPIAWTIAEACAAGRVGRTALYDAIKSGKLRAIKRGRRTLILPADLSRWLETMPARTSGNDPP
jgi:excisionase family DNA binding protein